MTVTFPFARGGFILAPVHVRHGSASHRVMMLLDTGARRSVITPGITKELGSDPDSIEKATRIVGATGTAWAGVLPLDSVSVLGIEVTGLEALCHALPKALGIEGILGMDFLNRFRVVIDGPAETVTI
ncbi:MAG: retropepsin-like aspartic protease family protein, partial [Planctomycetota bacterium]